MTNLRSAYLPLVRVAGLKQSLNLAHERTTESAVYPENMRVLRVHSLTGPESAPFTLTANLRISPGPFASGGIAGTVPALAT